MTAAPVYVDAIGMACPLGLSSDSAYLAMMAGLDRKRALQYVDDRGRPIVGSRLEELDGVCAPEERWFQLLVYALQDLSGRKGSRLAPDTPLLCVVPEPAAPHRTHLAVRLSEALRRERPFSNLVRSSGGAQGAFLALARARDLLRAAHADAVVVCAADSCITPRRLLALSDADRLSTDDNSDGVIPGEAAACVQLSLRRSGAIGAIRGIGFGRERASLANDVPLRGDGVVAASRAALAEAGWALHEMQARTSDAAGEGYGFREQALAVGRQLRRNMESFPLLLPALSLGDTGCAAGLCGIVSALPRVAVEGLEVAVRSIHYASADSGERAAVVLERLSGGT